MINWEMELKKFAPAFKILTYYGTQKERKLKRQGWSKTNAFHICITSYKLVIQDAAAFRRKQQIVFHNHDQSWRRDGGAHRRLRQGPVDVARLFRDRVAERIRRRSARFEPGPLLVDDSTVQGRGEAIGER